jgi:hypothetical protein
MQMKIIGYDSNSVPRVFGEHSNIDVAETMCKEEAQSYVKHRPDTGPLSKWIFTGDNANG